VINPLTDQVDALRTLMIVGGATSFGLILDFSFLVAALALMVAFATRLYPKMIT
jgi:ABC-2 type transport system permease protein